MQEKLPMATTRTSPMAEQQRAEAFSALGFTHAHAFVLAATRKDGSFVELGEVKRMLEAGCTHDTALRILI
jgi:hypothetical protein